MGTVLLREDRFRHIDYLQPFTFDPGVLLIPTPSGSTDVSAVWMPFQNQVLLTYLQYIHFQAII